MPFSISVSILLKTGRPRDALAEWLSSLISATLSLYLVANSVISLIWESIDMACRSSDSEDFLAYRQYSIIGFVLKLSDTILSRYSTAKAMEV